MSAPTYNKNGIRLLRYRVPRTVQARREAAVAPPRHPENGHVLYPIGPEGIDLQPSRQPWNPHWPEIVWDRAKLLPHTPVDRRMGRAIRHVQAAQAIGSFLGRNGLICAYCGAACPNYTRDHVLPQSHGGGGQDNVVVCCNTCNRRKKNRTPLFWLMVENPCSPAGKQFYRHLRRARLPQYNKSAIIGATDNPEEEADDGGNGC